ncbi:MAG: 23S rRNA pseudouridine(1911/1915/1917) synthase RluD [Gammaproteobacteria bacterium]|nr:23S rRNA pseudouridine(1911/1915/1917) synthase RluD [Gammaproteobacteria bacterium]
MTDSEPAGQRIRLAALVPTTLAGARLDQALAELFPEHSRSRLKEWILAEQVRVDGRLLRPRDRLIGGEQVAIDAQAQAQTTISAQDVPLEILHADDALLVINKPAGLVVHPGAGNPEGTVQHGLLHYDPSLVNLPRSGIVHRLDKDTTGLMVVARSLAAHTSLVAQLQAREMRRDYVALCYGEFTGGGQVDAPIGRHPRDRVRMAVVPRGKPAVTHYRLLRRYAGFTLLKVSLETGRTHQIRVHMAHLLHPLVGDATYGGRLRLPAGIDEASAQALRGFRRQALHAQQLALVHPASGEAMQWQAPLPEDFRALLEVLDAAAGTSPVCDAQGRLTVAEARA